MSENFTSRDNPSNNHTLPRQGSALNLTLLRQQINVYLGNFHKIVMKPSFARVGVNIIS